MSLPTFGWLLVGIPLVTLLACRFFVIPHNEDLAAKEAAEVLKLMYLKADYEGTHIRLESDLRGKLRVDDLRDLVNRVEAEYGVVQEFRLDSFLPMPAQRAMTIFFNGKNERGETYHRLVMIGDARRYRVSAMWVRGGPYPEEKLRQRFAQGLVVKRE